MLIKLNRLLKFLYKYRLGIAFIASALSMMILLIWLVLLAFIHGTDVNTYAANGTFQLYNPLRRISDGQRLGIDFPFFHGIGIPLIHYPIFCLLGSGLFAVETSKWLISPIVYISSSLIFFYSVFQDIKRSTVAASLMTIVALSWFDSFWPTNSLIGLRGTLPVLIASALLWPSVKYIEFSKVKIYTNECIAIFLLGLSIPFGTEQGLAAIIAYVLMHIIRIIKTKHNNKLHESTNLGIKILCVLSICLLSVAIISRGSPFPALKYALLDVPGDQGWYFGTNPATFLTWSNLLPMLFERKMIFIWISIVAGIVALIPVLRTKKYNYQVTFMLIYGLIAFLGTTSGYYSPVLQLIPLQRMMTLATVATLVMFAFNCQRTTSHATTGGNITLNKLTTFVLAAAFTAFPAMLIKQKISLINGLDVKTTIQKSQLARVSDDYLVAGLGWKSSIDSFRGYIKPNDVIWSTYTSVYDRVFGNQLNKSSGGEDYIIHALGNSRRAAYEKSFVRTRPDVVITLKPSYFLFEEWLWNNHWSIYEDILTNYSLVTENNSHYLWKLKKTKLVNNDPSIKAEITDNSIVIPANGKEQPVVYSVTIHYQSKTTVPLANRYTRYHLQNDSLSKAQMLLVSLPSDKNTWTVPVVKMPKEDETALRTTVNGISPFSSLSITGATYRVVSIDKDNLKPFENNLCSNYSKYGLPTERPWRCDMSAFTVKY